MVLISDNENLNMIQLLSTKPLYRVTQLKSNIFCTNNVETYYVPSLQLCDFLSEFSVFLLFFLSFSISL